MNRSEKSINVSFISYLGKGDVTPEDMKLWKTLQKQCHLVRFFEILQKWTLLRRVY
jgi:hypothetical protein